MLGARVGRLGRDEVWVCTLAPAGKGGRAAPSGGGREKCRKQTTGEGRQRNKPHKGQMKRHRRGRHTRVLCMYGPC
jgi:hypothetical protein